MAEAAWVAEAGWVAEAESVLILKSLVSTGPPADAPQRRHYEAKDGRAGCTEHGGALPEGGERLTAPRGRAPPHSLTP